MTRDIEQILDRCIEAKRTGGDPEAILRANPEAADEVRPLLALVGELEALPDVAPTTEGLANLMGAMLAQQVAAKPAKRKFRFFSIATLARAAAVLFILLLAGWGTAWASSGAVPGDLLYPVKLATEQVKFFFTFNAENKVELRIVFSEERLKEAVKMQQSGRGIDKALLLEMLDEAKAAVEKASDLPADGRQIMVPRVAYMTAFQHSALEELKQRATPAEREALASCMKTCSEQCAAACRMMNPGAQMTCPMCRKAMTGADNAP